MVIDEIRRQAPGCQVEVLIPDFQGNEEAIRIVVDARPEILNHNTESVPRLYRAVRSGARYERTLRLLEFAKQIDSPLLPSPESWSASAKRWTSSSTVYRDLANVGVNVLTIGQYLRPSQRPSAHGPLLHPRRVRFHEA